ncbi:DUF3857 domain-containing protein [Sphingomonas gilva]|uniref:DUF3857 domain-containing protein n=1 Tax=Sphingomonas gilva TaxID=2305907 RepID=A0A396RNH8_9SPHN|nr:DUF3857 domain-containing protein [Sphingomonas gilva]RHW17958.1 DUF3857 domain-containing protein [Sphingomonas gilva]
MMMRGFLLAATALVATQAHAGDTPIYAPAPAWAKQAALPAKDKIASAPPLLIADFQQKLEEGELWAYVDTATRIASTQMLNQAGTIAIPWMPNQGDLIIHRVQIVRDGEEIDLLAKGERFAVLRREQELEQLKLTGLLTATMTAEGLRVGDVLRLTASITRKDQALGGNVQTVAVLIPEEASPGFARVRLLWPKDEKVRFKTFRDDARPVTSTQGEYAVMEVPVPLPKTPELPSDAPMRYQRPPIAEASTFADWRAVSRTMAPLYRTEGKIVDGDALAERTDAIMRAHATPLARAAAALRLVQDDVRYLFRGMDGGNYVPQSPAETWTLRYGDCKAKTLLLLAMLHRMGIEAEAVLVNSALGDIAPERLPSAGAFDHVIVRAVIDGRPLWLDGTTTGTREADLADSPPFRHVLPLREDGADLAPLPMHANARPDLSVDLEIDQSAGVDLPTPYAIEVAVRGVTAEMLQAAALQANDDQKEEMVRGIVGRTIDAGLIADHSLAYDAEEAIVRIKANGLTTDRWDYEQGRFRTTLDRAVTDLSFDPDRARAAWKAIPVATGAPSTTVYRTRIKLPNDGKGFTLEGDTSLPARLAGIDMTRKATLDGGWLTVEDRWESSGAEIAPDAVPAERAAFAKAQSRLLRAIAPADAPPRWRLALDARKTKRFARIMDLFDQAQKHDPDDLAAYRSRAAFLDGIHDYRGAIPDVDRIIAKEPDVGAYLWRARLHVNNGDDAKAMADVEAAAALDPESIGVLSQRVWLLGEAGKIDEAIALLDERIASAGKDKAALLSMKSDALARAERTDAAIAAADAAVAAGPASAAPLNTRCWQKATLGVSLDTALKDCTKAIELAEYPAGPLDSRALVYFRMGRMDDARADLDAALAIDPSIDASLYLRGILRRQTGDIAGGDADLAAARLINPRMEEDYRRWGILR